MVTELAVTSCTMTPSRLSPTASHSAGPALIEIRAAVLSGERAIPVSATGTSGAALAPLNTGNREANCSAELTGGATASGRRPEMAVSRASNDAIARAWG
jgi:hypothetical protein